MTSLQPLFLSGASFSRITSWESMTIPEHMELYLNKGMDEKSAMKQVAKDRGVGKREIYQYLHRRNEDET